MAVTDSAISKITARLREDREMETLFKTDITKRREYMEMLLDTECGAEASGELVRFDLGCAQAIVPYEKLETAVLEALQG